MKKRKQKIIPVKLLEDLPAHATNSPSTLKRRAQCAGSRHMEDGRPDTGSDFAIEGSIAHAAGEVMLLNPRKRATRAVIFEVRAANKDWHHIEIQDDMQHAVNAYVAHVEALECDEQFIEMRVDLSDWDTIPNYGTSDFVGIRERTLILRDYKHGKGVYVEAFENPQNLAYALGAVEFLSHLYDFDTIDYGIVQPRMNNIQAFDMSADDLQAWGNDWLRPVLSACADDNAPLTPGDECKFCRANADCPALKEMTYDLAVADFEPYDDGSLEIRDASRLSAGELYLVYKNQEAIKGFLKAAESRIYQMLSVDSRSVPGVKRVAGKRGNRKFKSHRKLEARVEHAAKYAGIDVDELYTERVLRTPPQIEGVLGSEVYNQFLPKFVTQTDPKPTLVLEDDAREAIEVDGFTAVDVDF